jgi:hypothetical protein
MLSTGSQFKIYRHKYVKRINEKIRSLDEIKDN